MTREEYGEAYQTGFQLTVRFLRAKGLSYETSEEAAQAAWVRGWERLHQLRDASLVFTWANAIALNIYRNCLRHTLRMEVLPEISVSPNVNVAAIEVREILDCCSPKEGIALRRYYLEGCMTGEMAESQGITETAVRLRLMRARRAARRVLCSPPIGRRRNAREMAA